jgi:hypothetical protein
METIKKEQSVCIVYLIAWILILSKVDIIVRFKTLDFAGIWKLVNDIKNNFLNKHKNFYSLGGTKFIISRIVNNNAHIEMIYNSDINYASYA